MPLPSLCCAICTYRRPDDLDLTLASLARARIPEGLEWEVLVIDNAGCDRTAEVTSRWQSKLPIRLLLEPKPGLSHARQLALQQQHAQYLLFLDDDVSVDPELIAAYIAAVNQWPDALFLGGPIVPDLGNDPTPVGQTLLRHIPEVFSSFDMGQTPQIILAGEGPWGANFLLRTAEASQLRFDDRLGFRGRQGGMAGEETEFIVSLVGRFGGVGRYVPGARVIHRIPRSRQSWAATRRYATRVGASELYHEAFGSNETRRRMIRPWWLLRRAASELICLPLALALAPPDRRPALRYHTWRTVGKARAAWTIDHAP